MLQSYLATDKVPLAHKLVLFILVAAYVFSYAFVSAIPDTNRDMFLALGIARGTAFPLEGPILGGAIHLGPAWYYLLSLPLLLTSSWLATCLFVGFVASLKFPLAYICGRRILNAEFGLLWAAALSLPGWNAYERLTVFNPNPAATAVLVLIWFALHFRSQAVSPITILFCGVALGLGIHIHPTVAIAGFLPIASIAFFNRPFAAMLRKLGIFAIGTFLPLLPYFISQALSGAPDIGVAQTYMKQSIDVANLAALPIFLWGYLAIGPYTAIRYVADFPAGQTIAFCGLLIALHAIALAGIVRDVIGSRTSRAKVAAALMAFLLACAWIVVLRSNTPVYFTYMLSPFFCGLFAYGVVTFSTRGKRNLVAATCLIVVAFSLKLGWTVAKTMQSGVGSLPTSQEIKVKQPSEPYIDIWFPAYAHPAFGKFLCSLTAGTSLHGPLAFIADWNVDADPLISCGRKTLAGLGGLGTKFPLTGMPVEFWQRFGRNPQCRIGSIGFSSNGFVVHSHAGSIANGNRYLPRDFTTGELQSHHYRFDVPAGDAMLITNYLFPYTQLRIEKVTVNGRELNPIAITEMSRLYLTNDSPGTTAIWEIALSAHPGSGIDIVMLPAKDHSAYASSATETCGDGSFPLARLPLNT